MPWTSGSVTGHTALLQALKTFLTTNTDLVNANQNWVINKEETIASYNMSQTFGGTQSWGANFTDLYMQGPGLAQQDEVYVNLRTYEIPALSHFGWMIAGADDFDTDSAWESQPGISYSGSANSRLFRFLPLVDSLIEYWIVANGRRWILVCKVAGDFFSIYNGMLLPYALPSEFAYPLFISGTSSSMNEIITSVNLSSFFRPDRDPSAILRERDGTYLVTVSTYRPVTNSFGVWPWGLFANNPLESWDFVGNYDGSFSLLPAICLRGPTTADPSKNIYGELQGVYHIPGLATPGNVSPVSEDTITVGSDTYLVVQNCDRTDKDNYAAIKLE